MFIASITENIHSFFLTLDGWLYNLIKDLYKVFLILADTRIFSEETIAPFVKRIYMIIGVVMLFILSYDLLKAIVTPESKDKNTTGKTVFNVVKAIILLAVMPTIFELAYSFQDAILSYNTIGKIIIGPSGINSGEGTMNPNDVIEEGGITMAIGVLQAFIAPSDGGEPETVTELEGISGSLADFWESIRKDRNFSYLDKLAATTSKDSSTRKVDYHYIITAIGAGIVIYLMASYCLSLGLRVIKLAAYEIIAPIPIIASILPSKSDMLGKWTKVTLTTYAEVFIRVAILYLAVFLLQTVNVAMHNGELLNGVSGFERAIVKCIIFLGIISFMKQAPELISEITGIDSKKMSAGIKDQLKQSGAFALGGIAGAGALTLGRKVIGGGVKAHQANKAARNKVNEAKKEVEASKGKSLAEQQAANIKYNDALKARRKAYKSAAWNMTGGAIIGTASGMAHGYNKDAGSIKDVISSAKKGAEAEDARAAKSASYKAGHGGTTSGVVKGHFKDMGTGMLGALGIDGIEDLKKANDNLKNIKAAKKAVETAAKDKVTSEAAKSSSSFLVTDNGVTYTATELRNKQLAAQSAQGTPGYAAAKQAADQYEYDMMCAVQNQALQSTDDIKEIMKKASEGDQVCMKFMADYSGVLDAAQKFRTTIKSNLNKEAVIRVGFDSSSIEGALSATDSTGAFKKLGDSIDTQITANNAIINKKLEEQKKDSNE